VCAGGGDGNLLIYSGKECREGNFCAFSKKGIPGRGQIRGGTGGGIKTKKRAAHWKRGRFLPGSAKKNPGAGGGGGTNGLLSARLHWGHWEKSSPVFTPNIPGGNLWEKGLGCR